MFHSIKLFLITCCINSFTSGFSQNSIKFIKFSKVKNSKSKLIRDAVLVVGGAGKTGSEVIYQALKGGNDVVTLVRESNSKIKIPEGSGKVDNVFQDLKQTNFLLTDYCLEKEDFGTLTVFNGSVTNNCDVAKCFEENDIDSVVVALGGNTRDVGTNMLENGTRNIVNEMNKKSCKRIAVVTSVGTGDSYEQAPLFFKGLMATIYKDMFIDKNNQENIFDDGGIGNELDWCIIRPGGLTEGGPTGKVYPTKDEIGSISRADVADFCLGILDDNFEFFKEKVSISNLDAVRDHN